MSIDIHYDFHKRHYLPEDVILAGKRITIIGKDLVQHGVGFYTSKVNHPSFDGYGRIFIELFDTNAERTKLLTFLFDPEGNSLHAIQDRKSTEKTKENECTLEWIKEFCKNHAELRKADCVSRVISSTPKAPGEFYVYRHLFNDGRIYIGKGKGSRDKAKSGRGFYYSRTLKEAGEPQIERLCDEISEDAAYKIESELIKEFRLHYGYSFVINRTEGMEKEKDIGELPFGTLQTMLRNKKIKIDDPRFEQTVNIFKRFNPEIGSGKQYYKSIDIYAAAKTLHCSMNEVIRAKESSGIVINGFSILSDKDIEQAIAKP